MAQFSKLLEPIRIGSVELRNRIVMPGMGTNLANPDGTVSDRLRNYYEERARGGVGLIIPTHIKAESVIDPYPVANMFPSIMIYVVVVTIMNL